MELMQLPAQPITEGLSISANWAMVILAGMIGFFLVRTLNKIEKAIDKHGIEIEAINKLLVIHDQQLKRDSEERPKTLQVLEMMYTTLRAAQGE